MDNDSLPNWEMEDDFPSLKKSTLSGKEEISMMWPAENELVELIWQNNQVIVHKHTNNHSATEGMKFVPETDNQAILFPENQTAIRMDDHDNNFGAAHDVIHQKCNTDYQIPPSNPPQKQEYSSNSNIAPQVNGGQREIPITLTSSTAHDSNSNFGSTYDGLVWSGTTSSIQSNKRNSQNSEDHFTSQTEEDQSVTARKRPQRSSSTTRRSRAAEVHNMSERRRRDRINERMKALQELIPNSNKTDKASMLDEAIEYLKSLQSQVQMMWMSSASMPQMVFPNMAQRHVNNILNQQGPGSMLPNYFPVASNPNRIMQNHSSTNYLGLQNIQPPAPSMVFTSDHLGRPK